MFYAVAVWYGAVRWRRSWMGFAWVSLGLLGVLGVIQFHRALSVWTPYDIYLPVLQTLLWSYLALLAMVGYFVACIPRARPAWCCIGCGYDLTGVPGLAACCPECGRDIDPGVAEAALARSSVLVAAPASDAGDLPATHAGGSIGRAGADSPASGGTGRSMARLVGGSHLGASHRVVPMGSSAAQQPPQPADGQDQHRHAQHQRPPQG
ncbi:MAG: hypothetical protein KatS3mg103_0228 [Phycisphaerales bacterium]|nr:MAG: hypothetical protein KatS3mg103_0228 [Phycisphaerales bacterium]